MLKEIPAKRLLFPLSLQTSPEAGCEFSESLPYFELQFVALSHNPPGSNSQKALVDHTAAWVSQYSTTELAHSLCLASSYISSCGGKSCTALSC